jgi:hypothetical protein
MGLQQRVIFYCVDLVGWMGRLMLNKVTGTVSRELSARGDIFLYHPKANIRDLCLG